MDLEKKEELINFLKENLTISLTHHNELYEDGFKVSLELSGETISEDTFAIDYNPDI